MPTVPAPNRLSALQGNVLVAVAALVVYGAGAGVGERGIGGWVRVAGAGLGLGHGGGLVVEWMRRRGGCGVVLGAVVRQAL
jgi:hypothetical protein